VGDAIGAPVEFLQAWQIESRYGPGGPTSFSAAPGDAFKGLVTDDTQMTLFTLEGLIRAHVRYRVSGHDDTAATVQNAYLRWLYTQDEQIPRSLITGHLITESMLYDVRAPGNTCLEALRATAQGEPFGTIERPINNSKGCGAVMRAAPVAMWPNASSAEVFRLAAETGAVTHGHPSGYLSAGALAVIVRELLRGADLDGALDRAEVELAVWAGHEEVLAALRSARRLAAEGRPTRADIESRLGGGWVGEEALAIGVCAASAADDLHDGWRLAVNHSGDSDSTGSICGNILGAQYGDSAIGTRHRNHLHVRRLCVRLVTEALTEFGDEPPPGNSWLARYPPN
jgi:ADP-ribosylglycohydrolase